MISPEGKFLLFYYYNTCLFKATTCNTVKIIAVNNNKYKLAVKNNSLLFSMTNENLVIKNILL